jgi:hypothetical protein
MGLEKLILLDGRNRLGGYMTTVLVIGNTDSRWDEQFSEYASMFTKWENDPT